ncbi:MAG: hypothetical protein ACLQVD_08730 [Capsulimonadaceae bacterium]
MRGSDISTLRLLVWLKLVLGWRGFRANKFRWLSIILYAVMLVPVVMIAFGLHSLMTTYPDLRGPVERDALAFVYLIWVITPLLGFQLNESYDVTRLFAYPATRGEILAGNLLGAFLDPPVLMLGIPFVSMWLTEGAGHPGVLAADAVVLFLFVAQTLATAQAITVVFLGFLRSRRFRDITIVVFPIIGLAGYVGQQTLVHQMASMSPFSVVDSPAWAFANWLPSGAAAFALHAVATGHTGAAFGAALLLAGFAVAALTVGSLSLKRLYLGDQVALRAGADASVSVAAESYGTQPDWIPVQIAALMRKELTYLRRDPQYKAVLVQMVYIVGLIVVPLVLNRAPSNVDILGSASSRTRDYFGLVPLIGVTAALVMATSPLIFNIFGGEGAALTVLFSFPAPRRGILVAKNLSHGLLLIGMCTVALSVMAALRGLWVWLIPVLGAFCLSLPILLATGNLVSIRLPHRMLVRGQRLQGGSTPSIGGAGCAYPFLNLIAYAVAAVTALPVAAAVYVPILLHASGLWYLISLPLAAGYSSVLYWILLGVAQGWLLAREPDIVSMIVPAD